MKTGSFTYSMRRNKCRIYSIYSPWNLTKIKWKSFRNERRKWFGMLFEEQIPCSRKILELSGHPESKFQQFKQREGRATQLIRLQFEHSGVPRNLTCCPNGRIILLLQPLPIWFPQLSSKLFPHSLPLSLPVIQTSFWESCEDHPLSEDWFYMTKTARIFTIFNNKNTPPRDTPHFS